MSSAPTLVDLGDGRYVDVTGATPDQLGQLRTKLSAQQPTPAPEGLQSIPFQSPTTGAIQPVTSDQWDEALSRGYRPTDHALMYSPNGRRGMVPNSQVKSYVDQGYTFDQTTQQMNQAVRQAGGTPQAAAPATNPILQAAQQDAEPSWTQQANGPTTRANLFERMSPIVAGQPAPLPKTAQEASLRAKAIVPAIGASVAPELVPEMSGATLPWLAGAGASGIGAGAGTAAVQGAQGQNPLATAQLKESGRNAAIAGGTAAALGLPAFLRGVLPSSARAAQNFQAVADAANEQPVQVTDELSDALSRYQDLANRGGSRSMAVSKLVNRVTNPDAGPLSYEEARDFYSNISRLSADETSRLTPVMKRAIGNVRAALNDAIGQTATQAGVGPQYSSAMSEYANAARGRDFLDQGGAEVKRYLPWLAAGYGAKRVLGTLPWSVNSQ